MPDAYPVWIIRDSTHKLCCTLDAADYAHRVDPPTWIARLVEAFDIQYPERGPHRADRYILGSSAPRSMDDLIRPTITAPMR